eukprot:CAMPEP_0194044934 /NCGR_PEP_ID=MMETSP0009_2-20130614/16329_1 /TAXON_ID=210454 /ORGANISM="Grammatophora oceanica, Strain CCMP 410" /LENGTH=231 /DNA_ID=CAMNT_0038689621 /DNA_START=138 /DNA_END=833 /DNA_ORIENTATION=+
MDKIIEGKVLADEKSSASTAGSSDDDSSQSSSIGMAAVESPSKSKQQPPKTTEAKSGSSTSWSLFGLLFALFVQPFVVILNALGVTSSPAITADPDAHDDLFEAALTQEKKKEEARIAAERQVEEDRLLQAKAKEAKRIAREQKRAEEARLLLELIEEERRQQVEKIYQEMMKMRDDKHEKKREARREANKRSKSMTLQTSSSIAEEKPKARRVYFRENGRVRSYVVAKDI